MGNKRPRLVPREPQPIKRPDPDQPIKPETLKQVWLDNLENRNARLELIERSNEIARSEGELSDRIDALFHHAKIEKRDWEINFKFGTMTRRIAPLPKGARVTKSRHP